MSARDALARVLCKADGKVYWTEHIPAIYYTLADAVLSEWLPTLADDETRLSVTRQFYDDEKPPFGDPLDWDQLTVEQAWTWDTTTYRVLRALAATLSPEEEAPVPPA